MTFDVNSNLEARLREIAQRQGRDMQSVIVEALQRFADTATKRNGDVKSPANDREMYPLRGSVLRYENPCGPAVADSDWESMR